MRYSAKSVSVVVPAYNEEKRIGALLDKLLDMEIFPMEIVVVDNGSTDGTSRLVKGYKSKFFSKGIKLELVNEKKRGVGRARNAGFRYANGDIIASTDADCFPESNWISVIVAHFNNNSDVGVVGKIVMFDSSWVVKTITKLGFYRWHYFSMNLIFGFNFISTANFAVLKKYYMDSGGFDDNRVSPDDLDDVELGSRLTNLGTIGYNGDMVMNSSYRRYSGKGMLITSILNRTMSVLKISKKYKEYERVK